MTANGCHDITVPYPTASISLYDPFENSDLTGVRVEVDDDCVVTGWSIPDASDGSGGHGSAEKVALQEQIEQAEEEEEEYSVAAMRKKPRPGVPPFLMGRGWTKYVSW